MSRPRISNLQQIEERLNGFLELRFGQAEVTVAALAASIPNLKFATHESRKYVLVR
jgi:hypothetical protein